MQRIYKFLQDNTTLNNTLKASVFKPDSNTISFSYPAPQRGDLASVRFIRTVVPGDITGSAPLLNGPAQPVDVYQMIYYSSNSDNNSSVELVSGTLCIPSNITKSKVILFGRGAALATDDANTVSWKYMDGSSSVWTTKTPSTRNNAVRALGNVISSGIGYVHLFPDGFGVGISLNKTSLFTNYFSFINPQVDMLRAFKKYLEYTKSIRSNLFQNKFTGQQLEFIYTGYSEGAMTGAGVANEFMPGVSQSIPQSEAILFKPVKLILGANLQSKPYFDYLYTNRATAATRYINNTVIHLIMSVISGNYNVQGFATDNAIANILPAYESDLNRTLSETLLGTNPNFNTTYSKIIYDYTVNASALIPAGIQAPYLDTNTGVFYADWKQLMRENGILYLSQLIDNNLPSVSRLRSLVDLSNVPITNIYSQQDELIRPVDGVDQAESIHQSSNFGPDVNGTGYKFPGANKSLSYYTITGGSIPSESSMIGGILTQPNNSYVTYMVNATAYTSALNSHGGFGIVYAKYLELILAQLE